MPMPTARHTPHITYDECAKRYPRLTKALQYVAILSRGEAGCAIRDYRDGWTNGGGEAVDHYCGGDGLTKIISNAWKCRANSRQWGD